MPPRTWYRIVGRQREARDVVLRSRAGRFHDDAEAEPTTYGADSLMTAWREVTAGLGTVPANPQAFRAYRITLMGAKLADLRKSEEQVRQHITEAELLGDPPPAKLKEVSRRLRQPSTGYHGIVYRSVRNAPDGTCAALFLDRADERIALESVSDEEWTAFLRDARLPAG